MRVMVDDPVPARVRGRQDEPVDVPEPLAPAAPAAPAPDSTFVAPAAPAPVAAAPVAAQVSSDAPTVSAAQAATAAVPSTGYSPPADPANLDAILKGAGASQPPLSRDQVVQTVLGGLTEPEKGRASALISAGVTDESLARAFHAVVDASKTPGSKDIELGLVGFVSRDVQVDSGESSYMQTVTEPAAEATRFASTVSVDADRKVNGAALAPDVALIADSKPYPTGDSRTSVRTQFEPGRAPELPRQAMVDTVLAALPADQRTAAANLIAAGVTDDSLSAAFSQVIEARKTPGEKALSLSLVGFESHTEMVGSGENSYETVVRAPSSTPTTFAARFTAGPDGAVNGARLAADAATETGTTYAAVPEEFHEATLRQAGLSDEWLQNATPAQKNYALSQILEAAKTPGKKSLDLSYPYTTTVSSGESTSTVETRAAGAITLDVDAEGRIGGKPIAAVTGLNATRAVEAMSVGTRRETMRALGFPDDAIAGASAEQIQYALVKASAATATPGEARYEVHLGGDKYAVGMKIGPNGEIEGAGTAKIPPPPKKSTWKKIVSIVCTVVSICYPPAALICQGIQAALAISSGAKGLALIGAVAGAAAGVADIAGAASMATTLSTAANVANAANGTINAARSGNVLGALTGALTLSGAAGLEFAAAGSTVANVVNTAAGVAGVANAIKTGDVLGGLSAVGTAASGIGGLTDTQVNSTLATVTTAATVANAAVNGDYDAAIRGFAGLVQSANTTTTPATPDVGPAIAAAGSSDLLHQALDEGFETGVLGGPRNPGRLVTVAPGTDDGTSPLAITIHGINGSPDDVRPMIETASRAGQTALTFAYDDQHRRLTDSSSELAAQLGAWIDQNPGRPLDVTAHSMGSRVALAALDQLAQEGRLTMPVSLQLVAPPLGGYDAANYARLAPTFIGERISGVMPGQDMGTESEFQTRLEQIRLPDNVAVTVFTGANDTIVDSTMPGFRRIVDGLNAREVALPDADHMGAVGAASVWMQQNRPVAPVTSTPVSSALDAAPAVVSTVASTSEALLAGDDLGALAGTLALSPPTQADVRRIDNATVDPVISSRTVRSGDTLSRIAAETLGDANRWPELYAYNARLIGADPNRVPVGAELQIPPADYALPASTRNALHDAAHIAPPVVAPAGLSVVDAPFSFSLASDAASFASLSSPTALPGSVLNLDQIVDAAAAQGPRVPAVPAQASAWSSFTNGAVNTVRLMSDAVGSLVPGTASNQRVSQAMVDFTREVGGLLGRAAADPQGTANAIERAVGRAVFTVMDPRQWGEAAPALFDAVVHSTFDGTGRLADRLAQDPSSVQPGQLVLDAFGAATGLSNLLLVGAARNATVGAVDTAVGALRTEGAVAAAVERPAVAQPSWRVALEQNLGNARPELVDATLAGRSAAVAEQFAGTGLDLERALYHGTNSGALMGIASGEGLLPLGALRAQGRAPFSGELSGWGSVARPTESWNSYAVSSFSGADLNLGLRNYVDGFNGQAWTPQISARRLALIDEMPGLEGAQQGFNRTVELQRQAAWTNMSPLQRALVSDPFPMLVELRPGASRSAGDFSVQALESSGRAVATEVAITGGVTSSEIGTLFVPAERIAQVQQLLAQSGRSNIAVRALEPLQARAVDPLDLVSNLRNGRPAPSPQP